MRSLRQNFLQTLTGPCRISKGTGLVVAVSGGPDSTALLHLLADVRQQLELELTAVWVDHGLRPLETPKEKETVAEAATGLRISFIAAAVDAGGRAAEQRLSLEHAARDLRYAVLREAARECRAKYIAAAHTADDQAEEILLRLLRGGGRKGLSGMRMRSGDLIRPLLETNKETLLAWLTEQGIAYCLDSSNNDLKFLRNRVRHQLLPFLADNFDQGIKKSLRKTAASLAVDEELLEKLTVAALQQVVRQEKKDNKEEQRKMRILRTPFCALYPALQRRVVEQLLWRMDTRAGYDHILIIIEAAVSGRNNSELHLSRGLRVGIFSDCLEFSYPAGQRRWRGRLFSEG